MKTSFFKIVFALVFFLSPFIVLAGTEHNMSGWAWSSNIGWISFNSTNDHNANTADTQPSPIDYGVNKDDNGNLTGYAWSSNIGWIQFGGNLSGFLNGGGNAKLNGNNLTGWARALSNGGGWDGWISLSGTTTDNHNYGITLTDTAKPFCPLNNCSGDSFAWGSDVIGWTDFNGVIAGAAPLEMFGALFPATPSCTIGSGKSNCVITLSWAIENPEAIPTAITANNMTDLNVSNSLKPSSQISKEPAQLIVPYGNKTFNLYNNAKLLAQSIATATCALKTVWDPGTKKCISSALYANAGDDKVITLPVDSTSPTNASVSDPNGTISWTNKTLGLNAVISNGSTLKPTFSKLVVTPANSPYIFRLTVTDKSGKTASSDMQVTVLPAGVLAVPFVTLLANPTSIVLPTGTSTGSTVLSWSATNGPIIGCTATSNPVNTNWNGNQTGSSKTISDLGVGTYIYNLTCSNSTGASILASKTVTVTSGDIISIITITGTTASPISGSDTQLCGPGIRVTWTSNGIVSYSYNVLRSTTSGGEYKQIANTAGSLYDDLYSNLNPDLIAGATYYYYYVIQAVDANGIEVARSNQVSAKAPAACSTAGTWSNPSCLTIACNQPVTTVYGTCPTGNCPRSTEPSSIICQTRTCVAGVCPSPANHLSPCSEGSKSAIEPSSSKWTWTCTGSDNIPISCSENRTPGWVEPH